MRFCTLQRQICVIFCIQTAYLYRQNQHGGIALIAVRPYKKKDFRYVQEICIETSWLKDSDVLAEKSALCAMYCDYYMDFEPEFCFVAVDDNDIPVGYVLCSANADTFHEQMTEYYLPFVRKLSGSEFFRFSAQMKWERQFVAHGYTAHLHIDVLPCFQGQGVGTALLQELLQKLKDSFVEGVYLVCAKNNKNACAFYEARGFDDIDYSASSVVYGKKLYVEDDAEKDVANGEQEDE